MKIKTTDLTNAALDWAVAKCEVPHLDVHQFNSLRNQHTLHQKFRYSSTWAQGGPIIEQEGLTIQQSPDRDCWMAHKDSPAYEGPTPLIAALRWYVASKLGDEVEVPDELTQGE